MGILLSLREFHEGEQCLQAADFALWLKCLTLNQGFVFAFLVIFPRIPGVNGLSKNGIKVIGWDKLRVKGTFIKCATHNNLA
jgi:hypothetical protein